jgi:hypothetical protein
MDYRLIADAVMLVHFGFIAFVVAGGYLAWRWPRLIWAHVGAALWGFVTVLFSIRCPLTDVEDWARVAAGQEKLRGTGFIDTYIEDVIYPEEYTLQLQALAALVVATSWIGFARRRRRQRRSLQVSAPRP